MNYLEIVLQGYFNENNREFLDKYFFREFKKAEKEHFFEADEFFNGCLKIVDILKENYKKQYIEIQSELSKYLVSVKKEDRDNEFIQQQKEEIEYLKLNGNTNFRLNNGKNVVLKIEEISYIQNAIEQAFEKTQPEIEQLQPQSIVKQSNKLSDLITHQKSIEIIEAIKIQYKNIKGKRLKLLLLALQDLGLLPKERIAKKFHDCCKNEFDWGIARYSAMNDYKYNDITDSFELNEIKEYLKQLKESK